MANTDNIKVSAGSLADAFYETMLGVGKSLEARDEFPQNPEDFAYIVTSVVFDQARRSSYVDEPQTPREFVGGQEDHPAA